MDEEKVKITKELLDEHCRIHCPDVSINVKEVNHEKYNG